LILLASVSAVCYFAWSPQQVEAHGWRWRSGCGSYDSGYSYCAPQSYSQTYSNCSPGYGNYGAYYGSWYGNGYGAYTNYGSIPCSTYSQYVSPQYDSPQYGNFGHGWGRVGGGSLLGLMGGNAMAGANLTGSLVQPSYLSMPVGVGYGQSGYLQIPVGSPVGRASYLQIPVSTGYGPASYLQIELGRNPSNTVPNTPTPGPTPQPLGSAPAVNNPTASRFTNAIHQTSSDELPPVVATVPGNSTNSIVANGSVPSAATVTLAVDKRSESHATNKQAAIRFVSSLKSPVAKPTSLSGTETPRKKDTSFSFVDADATGSKLSDPDREFTSREETSTVLDRESTPWVVK
jgi:hypothetical protein